MPQLRRCLLFHSVQVVCDDAIVVRYIDVGVVAAAAVLSFVVIAFKSHLSYCCNYLLKSKVL